MDKSYIKARLVFKLNFQFSISQNTGKCKLGRFFLDSHILCIIKHETYCRDANKAQGEAECFIGRQGNVPTALIYV